jgi:hypothetical protein
MSTLPRYNEPWLTTATGLPANAEGWVLRRQGPVAVVDTHEANRSIRTATTASGGRTTTTVHLTGQRWPICYVTAVAPVNGPSYEYDRRTIHREGRRM